MADSIKFIFNLVIWFFVPLAVIIVMFYARISISHAKEPRERSAKKAGFWAGILLFFMALIYEVSQLLQNGFPDLEIYQGFNFGLAIFTALVTVVLFVGGKRFAHPHFTGFGILATVFVSLYIGFSYVFLRAYNELILSLTLGITFGYLAHLAFPGFTKTHRTPIGGHGGIHGGSPK